MKQGQNNKLRIFLDGFFSQDGVVANTLDVFSDFVILNILFLITCIPVVTIGASVTALWRCSVQLRNGEGGGVIRSFFSHWKQAFKRATPAWLVLLIVISVIMIEYPITSVMPDTMGTVFRCALTVLFILWLAEMIFIFPLLESCKAGRIECAKRAIVLAVINLPKALPMMIITALPLVLTVYVPNAFLVVLLVMLLLGAEGIAMINSILYGKMLFPPEW
jgi:uncharacterized membrane protein YesL